MTIRRIASIVLYARDPDALARFFRDALAFADDRDTRDGARRLTLGATRLTIAPAAPDAAPYPGDVHGWSPLFQHFAIRVADMAAAYARLSSVDGWRPISTDGPERLPAESGGVTAFKFRDPEGHPLELIVFPDRTHGPLFAGIDHTAISVADIDRSIAFYAALGFVVGGRSLNGGVEQSRMDAVPGATVDVVTLQTPSNSAPHLELLHYRGEYDRASIRPSIDGDVAATRWIGIATKRTMAMAPDEAPVASSRDPDGHRFFIGLGDDDEASRLRRPTPAA